MDIMKTKINSNLLVHIIDIPEYLLNKEVEIIIREPNNSIIDELYGIASNVPMTLDEIRSERLKGDEIIN